MMVHALEPLSQERRASLSWLLPPGLDAVIELMSAPNASMIRTSASCAHAEYWVVTRRRAEPGVIGDNSGTPEGVPCGA